MATFVNFLRLTELSTGEGSGTWGTTTNQSLELIGESLGYATQQAFSSDANATTTVADGVSDPARAMYFKVTSAGSLSATRTLTIAPNTISRVMFIENATTGSQSIAISQGSGANVTILSGKTAVVYLDGAGSGAAVVDAMAGVDPGVTDTLAEVLTAGNTTTTDQKIQFRDAAIYINSSADGQLDIVADTEIQIAATTVDLNGNLDVSGTTVSAGKITADAGIDIDNINIDGTTIALSSGSLTLDVAGQVVVDADDEGTLTLKNSGTQYGIIFNQSNDFKFKSLISDGDIVFLGNDGGSGITALTLDMSAAGAATFNAAVLSPSFASTAGGTFTTASGNDLNIVYPDGRSLFFKEAGTTTLTLDNAQGATFAGTIAAGAATFSSTVTAQKLVSTNGVLELDDNGSHNGVINSPASLFINIDSDNGATGEDFVIGKDRTGTSGGTELFRVQEDGRAGIGTSAPDGTLHVHTASAGTVAASSQADDLVIENSAEGGISIITPDDQSARIRFTSPSTNTDVGGATIFYRQNINTMQVGTAVAGGVLSLVSGAGAEGLRVDASSNVLVGTTTLAAIDNTPSATGIGLKGNGSLLHSVGDGGNAVEFRINGTGAVGSINCDGSATAYNTSSDYRLKKNVVGMSGATERLKQLKPSRFNFIRDADTTVDGFLAHEVQDIVPEAITGAKDAVDADGNPQYQGIDQSKLVPLLVATIQELEARIAALES